MEIVTTTILTSQSRAGGKAVGRQAIEQLSREGYKPVDTPKPPSPWVWEKCDGKLMAITQYQGPFRLKIEFLADIEV